MVTLEEISNKNFREHKLIELESLNKLLGVNSKEHYIDVLFGNEVTKCRLARYGDSIQAEICLDKSEYSIDNLSLESGVYFNCDKEVIIRVNSLKENTRTIMSKNPVIIADRLEIFDMYSTHYCKITKETSVTFRCLYNDYVSIVYGGGSRLKDMSNLGITKLSIKLNLILLNQIHIYFTGRFFEYNDKMHEIAKQLHWKKVSDIYWDDYIKVLGTAKMSSVDYTIKSNNQKDKALVKLILEYLFEELKRNFKEFGIDATIIWGED